MLKIAQALTEIKKNYDTPIQIIDGLFFKQKDIIRIIEFGSNSRYLNGQVDELGREKPYYNIRNAVCDVENAAKDIDTKDITATSDDGEHYTESFLMSKDIYEWMKKVSFAKTLNDMRDTHTAYGSLLVKKCEYDKDGEKTLKIEIPEWKNVITDQTDIANGPIIEVHYMTPKEIMKMTEWNEDGRKAAVKQVGKEYMKRIAIYEVRGEFPVSWVKELDGSKIRDKDETDFSYQLYYLAGEPKTNEKTVIGDTTLGTIIPLYWEDDTEKVYKYLARKRKAGRDFGVGVFEEGDEAQVWTNDAVMKQFRAMEYTTKSISQTASKKLKGRNVLTEVDDGAILEHEDGKPITAVNLLPSGGLHQYQELIQQWNAQLESVTSAYAMQRGEVTTRNFRLQSLALQQSDSVFKNLQEELGIFITEIFMDWIMPHLAKQLNTEHILAHDFTMDELKEIDKNFSIYHANDMVKQTVLSGKIVTPEEYEVAKQSSADFLKQTKSQRFLQVPKDYYKKFKAKITVNVTGEQKNKAMVLESLMNLMKVYASNPQIAQDPVLMQIFMKIVELSGAGISPVQLMGAIQEQAKQQMDAQKNGGGGKVSESMSFKDLPPDGQVQMAQQAGIKIAAPAPPITTPQPAPQGKGSPPVKNLSLMATGGAR